MTRVDSLVRSLVLDHHGKVVKNIGDALMLAFRQPADAAGFAGALHDGANRDPSMPGPRVGIHCRPAIYRAGDYLGTTVNLASRVTTTATGGQTVLTEAVAQRLGDGGPIEPLGVRMLRGAEQPVQLYRLTRHEQRRDPACGRNVQAPPAARLGHGADELLVLLRAMPPRRPQSATRSRAHRSRAHACARLTATSRVTTASSAHLEPDPRSCVARAGRRLQMVR